MKEGESKIEGKLRENRVKESDVSFRERKLYGGEEEHSECELYTYEDRNRNWLGVMDLSERHTPKQ